MYPTQGEWNVLEHIGHATSLMASILEFTVDLQKVVFILVHSDAEKESIGFCNFHELKTWNNFKEML